MLSLFYQADYKIDDRSKSKECEDVFFAAVIGIVDPAHNNNGGDHIQKEGNEEYREIIHGRLLLFQVR